VAAANSPRREDVVIRFRTMFRRRRAVLSVLALTLLVIGSVSGCSTASPTATGARIDVTMHDFGIKLSRHSVLAGKVVLRVTNDGPSTHEINVDRTRYPTGKLPLQRDGLTAAEDAPGLHRIDSIEQLNLHRTEDLTLDLKPGRYVLWCNLEGHYLGGMHETFDVR
jgi:uncharacterized cupredoxin-like copper-binding protein